MPHSSFPAPSILKTSKLASTLPAAAGRKRKMMDIDMSSQPTSIPSEADTGSPVKRPRVKFDSSVETRHLPDLSPERQQQKEKSVSLVREEVRRAIQRHVSGADSEAYDLIKQVFATDARKQEDDESDEIPSPTSMKRHLMGLLSNVSLLDGNCSGLVNAVLSSEWLGRDEPYVKLFIRFLGNLSAAHSAFLRPVLKMLVNYLGEIPKGTGRIPGYAITTHGEIYDRVHMALRYLMQLLPAGSVTLSPILSGQFPFDTDSAQANVCYTRNLTRIIEYVPELQAEILALITEKLVKIDVQIQVDMEDFEDEVGEGLLEDLSRPIDLEKGDDEDESDNDSVASDDDITDVETRRLRGVKENIRKIDSMIDHLFEFYSPPFAHGTDDEKNNALDLLIAHFEGIILPTYRSRHTQFLLFHFSQSSPDLVERFAATCIHIIFSKSQPAIRRQSAAAYLGSFVARGKHVSPRVVRDVFDMLGDHLDNLRAVHEKSCRGPDLRRYGPFYATAQALLYIFCFRWRDLTTASEENDSLDNDDIDLEDVNFPQSVKEVLHRAIYSKLNPLKVCSPAIVSEFARIAHHLRFLYVYSLLESNKRLRMSTFRNMSTMADPHFAIVEREIKAGNDGGYQLDAYFPFDPYQLPQSRRWLDGDYVEWRGIPGLDDQDEDSDSAAEDQDADAFDDDEPTGTDEE
ncbi:RNA polymerase I-specific transcription initiation factor RRN3 superfamily [Talaromyces proteolyticus]|uniref:RNA polymerase I-specific transcription initiation factor RRN3 superfamily n=1 Tax=Talaromyces proteolyticus TaxID=1131652 RepID=A0AAD4Q2T7_9EURO|nr:RNA polymerase I-specific transcription initiation factor RRN3 superfamily [Talaromyces proteolyticus]KAH8700716.1 RNA polymerase I-specific transcription initiation factor RRN3 superfamily [Talaromyces proteolyticus]